MTELTVLSYVSPPMDTNAYLVADDAVGQAVAIDPACMGQNLLSECEKRNWRLSAVILTHGHIDHVADAALMAREGLPVLIHADDAPMLADPAKSGAAWLGMKHDSCEASRFLSDGDSVQIGAFPLRVINTPGHTPGCICLVGDNLCFTGDLLFQDAVGRWDFPGGNQKQLIQSIRRLAADCADDVRLYPGHGPHTTMGRERRLNPYLLEWL